VILSQQQPPYAAEVNQQREETTKGRDAPLSDRAIEVSCCGEVDRRRIEWCPFHSRAQTTKDKSRRKRARREEGVGVGFVWFLLLGGVWLFCDHPVEQAQEQEISQALAGGRSDRKMFKQS